ncbi:UDP-glucose-4-epimerase [Mycobacterium leprae Kyoto-2]|uniref:Exopolysaccharide phosphotransferase CpsY n=3 Tax=Mycobacterium leprae TaxID=1769 RepID=CPSY_MYCLE|nr:stealth conserved region 3 domain-containing protein [Mycobacterium leprae]Q50025.1 RecName: Full=Exopolysaccharide phosphotransferase CpsY; AltName: Full=Stealth protein CpsY [Mycobacterium leprae TN]CAR72306.1 probable UDP-glucose-4-epimerase [Mycobacterium leprae Br4923]AAA62996.1 cpsY [Mycobacterium leprae]AWV48530.1 exopolysaccharide phosphotransferase CpsY [Mycobacterium leprae]OAR20011.1 sugar phosphotransferase [Mycobacterium leprae 3125609]OAX71470.1 sugar phosphotransferase [Myco
MSKIVSCEDDRPVRRTLEPIIVTRQGKVARLESSLTPHEAQIEDLIFLRKALNRADIPFLFIRNHKNRPVLAINIKLRPAVERALVTACASEPMYAKTIDERGLSPVLVAKGQLSQSIDPRIVRLYRRRIAPGGFRFGSRFGVELQFWSFEETLIRCPVENSLTRKVLPRKEVTPATIKLYGYKWHTIEGMFTPHASDVTFDIDLVFSWVDGSDPEFRARRAAEMSHHVVGEGDDADARIRQIDELKYALRSVNMFAPWIRRIFIATDSIPPSWLADHPMITIVPAEDHFSDRSALPTYNSHAVESQLHRIPDLSEHFLYSNDDMFFGRPLKASMFFSPGGVTRFIEAKTRIGLGTNDPTRSGFENAARVNRQLLLRRFGQLITRHLEHTTVPLRKSVLFEMEQEFPEEFARTQESVFRSGTDISVTNSLYHYYALITGRAVQQEKAKVLYVDTTSYTGLNLLPELRKRRNYDFFCLNDGSFPEVPATERAERVVSFLERYFPIPAPWEKVATDFNRQDFASPTVSAPLEDGQTANPAQTAR